MTRIPERNGVEQIWSAIRALQQDAQKRRGLANLLENATISRGGLTIVDEATTARMLLANGQIKIWDDYAANPDGFGLIYCDAASSANLLRWFPPHDAGTGLENSVTLRGSAPGVPGAFWLYTDGVASFQADDRLYLEGENSIDLVAPKLRLYGLSNTGTAANLALDVIAGEPIVRLSVSSDRYKVDLQPVDVDIDDLLAYEPITWLHQSTLDATPAPWAIRRNVGNHAEAMAALPSLRQFVNFDDQGEPDSVEDSRFTVAVHQGWKHTHGRVVELEREVTDLKATVIAQAEALAVLTSRLDALELKHT